MSKPISNGSILSNSISSAGALDSRSLLVEAREASKVYGAGDGATVALDRVDLGIGPGEFVAIMGRSGSGKTTLLNVLAGLDRPTSGSVWLGGERIDALSETELAKLRRRRVGFVFQFFNLIPTLTAGENVELPLRLAGRRRNLRSTATAMMAGLGVDAKRDVAPALLSGGEQQRVALARALVNQPDILFADEPTGNLDSLAARDVVGLLKEIHRRGQTLVVVTHDGRVAAAADRVVSLRDGRLTHDAHLESTSADPWLGLNSGAAS
jgi:putative ABC transport system ATP-binding protein